MAKTRKVDPIQILDSGGNIVNFHVTDGESTFKDLSIVNYKIPVGKRETASGFHICPLVAGTITGRLKGQTGTESYTVYPERTSLYIGSYMEENWDEIYASGTDVTKAMIAWNF